MQEKHIGPGLMNICSRNRSRVLMGLVPLAVAHESGLETKSRFTVRVDFGRHGKNYDIIESL